MRGRGRKSLIALSAAVASAMPLARSVRADDEGGVNLFQVSQFSHLEISTQDYGQLNPNADQLAKPTMFALQTTLTDAIWVGSGGNSSWLNPTNWSTALVPNDESASARFRGLSGGPIVQLNNATVTLGQLELSDPLYTSIVGGTIVLANQAVVNANGTNFDLPERVFTSFGTTSVTSPRPGNNIGGVGSLAASFAGTLGLNKTGDTHLQIDSQQYYSGTTSITGGGKIITTIGDTAFGNAANGISLSNGSIQVTGANWISNRTIDISGGGGSIYWVDTGRSISFGGNFTGGSHLNDDGTTVFHSLYLNGNFGTNVGSAVLTAANSFVGQLNISGTVGLSGNGAIANINELVHSGTLIIDDSTTHVGNRLSNTATLNMHGAALTVTGGSTNYDETTGPLRLDGGLSVVTVNPGTGGAALHFGTMSRGVGTTNNNAAGMYIRGMNLGSAPGANVANVYLTDGTSLLVNGILPFAWGNGNASTYLTAETPDNTLLTYGANGVTPIAADLSTFSGSNSGLVVRISGYGSTSLGPADVVNGQVNLKALILAAPSDMLAPNSPSTGGMTVVGDSVNNGTLVLASGVILSAHAGLTNSSGTPTNSLPGNVVYSGIDFGTKQGVILTPSAITLYGNIHGSNGLIKIGGRTAQFAGQSDYHGQTILTGFNRFIGSVREGFDNPFGAGDETSPIVIYGGNASPSGTGIGQLGSNAGGGSSTSFERELDIRGDTVLLRNFGAGTLVWDRNITVSDPGTVLQFLTSPNGGTMTVGGQINGPGKVVIGSADVGVSANPWVNLKNSASFAGGLVLAGGTIGIGNDRALGSHIETTYQDNGNGGSIVTNTEVFNTVQVSGNTLLTAIDGARSIANNLIVYGSTIGFGGSLPLNLTGNINGRGGDYITNITASTTINFSGILSGGGFAMQRTTAGNGTLILSGTNTFTGVLAVGNSQTGNDMLILENNSAVGSTISPTIIDYGNGAQNTLGLRDPGSSGLNIAGETLDIRGTGISNIGALYNIAGNNTWSGVVRPSPTYDNAGLATVTAPVAKQIGAIGVAPSTTLTLSSGIFANDTGALNNLGTLVFSANSIGVRKVNTGTLVIGSHNVNTQIQVGPTTVDHYWNAAVDVTGSLDIQGGTVRIKPLSGVATISGGKSVVDVGSLNIAGGTITPSAQLDLTSNGLLLDYSGSSPITSIRNLLKAGYANGSWNGNGIISSLAATSPNAGEGGQTGLGYAEATAVGNIQTFYGDPIRPTSSVYDAVVVRYTYNGDTNLDGQVDMTDLINLAKNWGQSSNQLWTGGDFTYDGSVTITDLYMLAKNWQVGVALPLPGPALDHLLTSFGLPDITETIPEPTTTLLGAAAFAATLSRRRRRSSHNVSSSNDFHPISSTLRPICTILPIKSPILTEESCNT